jgi:hypothetical protein
VTGNAPDAYSECNFGGLRAVLIAPQEQLLHNVDRLCCSAIGEDEIIVLG